MHQMSVTGFSHALAVVSKGFVGDCETGDVTFSLTGDSLGRD